jgi:predicted ATPase
VGRWALPRRIVISGCSGGGKSTLVDALAGRGFPVVLEPGRRIVQSGGPMPWHDPAGFARRAVALALDDWEQSAITSGTVFFDRGLVDAIEALRHVTGTEPPEAVGLGARYDPLVFLAPPWPDLFAPDADRRHDLTTAIAEYERLHAAYPALGYRPVLLPDVSVADRVAFVLETLGH